MTDPTRFPYALPDDGTGDFALKALKIVFFTGFALVATILGFVFLPVAGLAFAAWVAWKGFGGGLWTERDFALRALSLVAFTGFAVLATVLAFVFLPFAGVALAALLMWRGFGFFGLGAGGARATGNTAFDGYRDDTLHRVDDEEQDFDAFRDRMRESKDRGEFDRFMDERERRTRYDIDGTADPA